MFYIIIIVKPTFHHKAVNGPFEDPTVYMRVFWEKRAFLFDAGDLWTLAPGEVYKITDVFITHTHMDHFIGFDRLLRAVLGRKIPLRIFGPEGIIHSIKGKLQGYTWNLIEEYPITLIVHEISSSFHSVSEFSARNGFRKEAKGTHEGTNTILEESLFSVRAAYLNHGIPVLAFSVEEGIHINIDKTGLSNRGLPVGPWLSALKSLIRKGELNQNIIVNGRPLLVKDLMDIVRATKGQKVSYVVDVSPTEENIIKIVDLVKGSHTLYIETYYMDGESERAQKRNHLTARIAGEIAAMAGVKEIIPLHISPKYRGCPEKVINEAIRAFISKKDR